MIDSPNQNQHALMYYQIREAPDRAAVELQWTNTCLIHSRDHAAKINLKNAEDAGEYDDPKQPSSGQGSQAPCTAPCAHFGWLTAQVMGAGGRGAV